MDPLSALSLAGTVVQFVDFGCKLLSEGRELYHSSSGKLDSNNEIEIITTDLLCLVRKLRDSFLPSDSNDQFTEKQQEERKRLQLICARAATIAEEIIEKLQKLIIPQNIMSKPRRSVKTLAQLLKAKWNRREIADLVERLEALRKAIDTSILFSTKENLNLQAVRLSALYDQMDTGTQRILTSLLENQDTENQQVVIAVAQMMSRLEEVNQEAHRQTQSLFVKWFDMQQMVGISAGVEMLAVSSEAEASFRDEIQAAIINSLRYATMTNRYEDIAGAFPQTLEWAFHDSNDEEPPRANLAEWLRNGKGIYWVNGKPGSGKSTLLKHIFDDRRTRRYLQHWTRTTEPKDVPLSVATFFFWNSGTSEQKSQSGLFRAILHQVLDKNPDLVPIILPSLWADMYSKYLDHQNRRSNSSMAFKRWALQDLKSAVELLVKQVAVPVKLFFLIDGLDEFDGDHEELIAMFRDLAHSSQGRLRACLSSRPWVVFEQNLQMCTSLRMQDLTYKDIEIYVNEKLHSNPAFNRLAAEESGTSLELIKEIVQKADGVFLWVHIVVRSLLRGIQNLDEMSDLWKRVRLLPKELEPLYEHLMEQIEPIYWEWVSKVFRIVQVSRGSNCTTTGIDATLSNSMKERSPLTLIALYLSMGSELSLEGIRKMTPESIEAKCHTLAVQLTARCGGFLETSSIEDQGKRRPTSCVNFLHRTARDFLEDKKRWAKFLAPTRNTSFQPAYALTKGCSLCVVLGWYLHGEGYNYPVMQEMWMMARDALTYAHEVNIHWLPLENLSKVFEEMGKAVSWDEVGRHKWTYKLIPESMQTTTMSFLDLAALFGLSQYVLVRVPKLSRGEVNSLLNLLLSGVSHPSLPLPSAEIISALRSHLGALDSGRHQENLRTARDEISKRKLDRVDGDLDDLIESSSVSDSAEEADTDEIHHTEIEIPIKRRKTH